MRKSESGPIWVICISLLLVVAGVFGYRAWIAYKAAQYITAESQLERNTRQLVEASDALRRIGESEHTKSADKRNATAGPSSLSIVAWNVESDGNDPKLIAKQLADFRDDIVCLSEVHPDSIAGYAAVFPGYVHVSSLSGREDRLMIMASPRFEILDRTEHDDINDGRHRSPLSLRLKDKQSGESFVVMTVHLARGNADFRTEQAAKLVEWAREETIPIIAIGDFNMDYEFETDQGNEAFAMILRDGVFTWLKPDPLVDTNWFGDEDGNDVYPDSMLDFAFVANGATEWDAECDVVIREGDFPDDERKSDHRAIRVIVRGDTNQ